MSCQELLNDFLQSKNEVFKIYYRHNGKVYPDGPIGHYKNAECIMNKHDFGRLLLHQTKYTQDVFKDKLIYDNIEFAIISSIVLTSK